MIGKVCKSRMPYYDRVEKTIKFKCRPCLVIGMADSEDYVILPISTIADKKNINTVYDIPLNQTAFSFLNKNSYLRTHKQTVVNIAALKDELIDFKESYEDTYAEALQKVEQFQSKIILDAGKCKPN